MLIAGCATATSGAQAVLITQHPLTAPATNIFGWSGGLYVSGGGHGAVSRVNTTPMFSLTPGPASASQANHLTLGPDGNPWFLGGVSEGGATFPALFSLTQTSVALQFKYPQSWNHPFVPGDIVSGPDRALWMADWGIADAIERWQPGAPQLSVYKLPSGGSPISIVAGPEDALWFTDSTGKIGRITTAGEISEYPIADANTFGSWGFAGPYGITVGLDGALWFAEQAVGRIGRMTPAGQLQEFAVPTPPGLAEGMARPAPRHIVAGPDGTIWFTDPGDGSIGRVTTGGEVSEYPVPVGSTAPGDPQMAVPDEIAIGPEGLPWFTDAGVSQLGSVDPNAIPPVAKPTGARSSRPRVARSNARCRRRVGRRGRRVQRSSCRRSRKPSRTR